MIRVPRLQQNRHGVCSLRVIWQDPTGKRRETLHSLGDIAHKLELDLSRGVMKSDDPEDFDRMMKAIEAYKAIHGANPPLQQAMNMGRAAQPITEAPKRLLARSSPLSEAWAGYIREKQHDNAKRTIYEKGLLFEEFKGLLENLEVNLYDKPTLVQWKWYGRLPPQGRTD